MFMINADYNTVAVDDIHIKDIHNYLMKKNNNIV